MEEYKFNPQDGKAIVNAIVEGYQEYIDHRKDRHNKMTISSAFAWTKGNFIESKIAEISSELKLSHRKAKAGLTWDYLQFTHGDTKKLFLIKNAAYFNEKCFSQAITPSKKSIKGRRRTYLHELSKINEKLHFTSNTDTQSEHFNLANEQLSLFVSEKQAHEDLKPARSLYNEFHILTYKIGRAFQISEIIHYLPNPKNNIAYRIADLSNYISSRELTDEERDIIAPEQHAGIMDPAAFDIGIFEEEDYQEN